MQTSVYILLKIGLENILLEIPDRLSDERTSIKTMIDQVQKELDYLDGNAEKRSVNSYWPGIKQFLDQKYSVKIQQVTLDTIQKMITNKLFTIDEQTEPGQLYIMDDIVQSVVQCYPLSKLPDDSIQLQIIKVFLTMATSCTIHGKSLESILRICMLIHLQSKSSSASQITAKAALMQIINMLFTIIESEYDKIAAMKKDFEDDSEFSIVNDSSIDRIALEDTESSLSIADKVYTSLSQPLLEPPGKFGYCHQCLCPAHLFDSKLERPKCGSCKVTIISESSNNDTLNEIAKAFILKSHELYLELLKEDCLIGLELLFDTLRKYERKGAEKAKILCYELILSILNNAGPCFKSDSEFIAPLGTKLSISLSSNGLSSNPVLFELCLGIFLTLVLSFRSLLKTQIEILFREIYLRVFDIPTSTMHQRLLVAQSLIKICSTSQLLADIYVNYDCDLAMECIYEKIILCFAKISMFEEFFKSISVSYVADNASSYSHILDTIKRSSFVYSFHTTNHTDLNVLAMKGFIATIRSLMQLKKQENNENNDENIKEDIDNESDESLDTEDYSLQMIEKSKTKKQLLRQGIYLFNTLKHPYDGIQFLARHGLVDDNNVASIARFLHTASGIDKKALGAFLGEPDSRSMLMMHAFIDAIDFTEIADFVKALRLLLSIFHLPGEAQKIDRIMEKFADRYCECNPTIFSNADTAYTLAYSIIMLNTDLHSTQVKVKMTKDSFIKNNSNIHTSEITDDILSKIYDDILNEEIVLDNTSINKYSNGLSAIHRQFRNTDSHDIETERIKTRSEALFKEARKAMQYVIASPEQNILSDMIRILTLPMMGSLFVAFSSFQETTSGSTDKEELIRLVLQCFVDVIQMLSNTDLQIEKNIYVLLLYQCTKASGIESISLKKIWAIKSLLFVGLTCGEYFEFDEWVCICKCLSMLDLNHLVETPILKTQLVVKPEKKQSHISYTTIAASGLIYPRQLDTLLSRSLDITADQHIEFTSASHIPVTRFSFRSKRISTLAFLQNLVQEQDIPRIIDAVFTNSISLNAKSVMELFRALCKVSTEELFGDENIESANSSISAESIPNSQSSIDARIFCLQKIVETAYYNMDRIRFEWSQIWKILQPHFNKAGLYPQMHICILSIDSLRQLTIRFLERDELGRYHTQNELLKSFEYIMRHTIFLPVKEQILSSFDQMISIQASNIKSGWRTILSVLSKSVHQIELQPLSLLILNKISSTQCFDLLLVSTGCLADYVLCLTDLICYSKGEDISLSVLRILQTCHSRLYDIKDETIPELNRIQGDNIPDESTRLENQFHFKWLPLFTCFTRIITDSSLPFIRSQAVDILFQMLMKLDKRWAYNDKYWKTIYRCVLFPIFDLLSDDERKAMIDGISVEQPKYPRVSSDRHLTSIWIHMLRLWIDLVASFPDILLNTEYSLLSSFLTLLETCIHHSEEHLAQSCILCFYHLICKGGGIWGLKEWSCMQTFLIRIVHWTLPIEELLSEKFTLDDFHTITWRCSLHLGIVQVISDVHALCINEMQSNKERIFCKLFYKYPLSNILSSLEESFNFASTFNSNIELRTRLAEAGNVSSIDGIVLRKQHFNSLTEYLCILAYTIHYYTMEKISDTNYLSSQVVIPFEKCTKMNMVTTIELLREISKGDNLEGLSDLECWMSLIKFILETLLSMDLFFYYKENDQMQKQLGILVKSLSDQCLEFVSIQGSFTSNTTLEKERSTLYPVVIEFIKTVQKHFLKI